MSSSRAADPPTRSTRRPVGPAGGQRRTNQRPISVPSCSTSSSRSRSAGVPSGPTGRGCSPPTTWGLIVKQSSSSRPAARKEPSRLGPPSVRTCVQPRPCSAATSAAHVERRRPRRRGRSPRRGHGVRRRARARQPGAARRTRPSRHPLSVGGTSPRWLTATSGSASGSPCSRRSSDERIVHGEWGIALGTDRARAHHDDVAQGSQHLEHDVVGVVVDRPRASVGARSRPRRGT